MYTNRDAQNYVIASIEANGTADRAEYDVDAIVNDVHAALGTYDFTTLGIEYTDEFWAAVQRHER